jgi:hypothetical protein
MVAGRSPRIPSPACPPACALHERWLLLPLLSCLGALGGCHPRPLPAAAPVVPYAGTWEYRYGELVRGTNLKLVRSRYRELGFAVAVTQQIAEGLAAIHALGIIHRDLKAANVLLTEGEDGQPRVKLADFGVSTFLSGPDSSTAQSRSSGQAPRSQSASAGRGLPAEAALLDG